MGRAHDVLEQGGVMMLENSTQAFLHGSRFILRWPKNYQLLDEQEQLKKPAEIIKGKRSWDHRLVWDARRRCERQTA
jgi:hypothetical protein